jgi:MFS family permease
MRIIHSPRKLPHFPQILQLCPSKYVYLVSLFIFELGSLICGVAKSMGTLIAGRTVAGIGAAGLFMACFQILIETTSMTNRAMYMGFIGAIFGISTIAAPSIGGALSQQVSWRWCFYINLPCAVVAAAGIIFILKTTKPLGTHLHKSFTWKEKLEEIDFVGTTLLSGFFVMIVIPIQQSTTNGWNTARTIAPLVCSLLVLPLIYLWFRYIGEERALMPIGLLKDKNLIGCCLTSFFSYWNVIVVIYIIPFMFQTVKGSSPEKAGVELLPLLIPMAIGSVIVGVFAKKFGQYYPFFLIGITFGSVGAGLAWHLTADSRSSYQIGTQILLGLSVGPLIQMPILAAQANTKKKVLMSKANGMVVVASRLGGGIGVGVANAILYSQLPIQIQKRLPAGIIYKYVEPTEIYQMPLGPIRDAMLAGLTYTIRIVYVTAVPIYFLALLAVLLFIK